MPIAIEAKSLVVFGRQPAIGLAELESMCGAAHVQPLSFAGAALSDLAATNISFARLGGSVKLGAVVAKIPASRWPDVQAGLTEAALACAAEITEGKLQLGISCYGVQAQPRQLLAAGLTIKKTLRARGQAVRLVPNQTPDLSSAQVLHNHLAGERGIELLAVRDGSGVIIARTTAVQDINAYAARDQHRPKRDARVGMLPPKLAQTIVNIAVGTAEPRPNCVVLDPFCGTGVVLQEARLMGFGVYGSDIEPRMIDYSQQNLAWLDERFMRPALGDSAKFSSAADPTHPAQLDVGDACTHRWQPTPDFVAGETYLGQPLATWPAPEKLQHIISTCDTIIEKFLRNLAAQTPSGFRACLAVPAWRNPQDAHGRLRRLPLLDRLENLGYNRISFEHVRTEDLVYFRPDQLVARELLVITRK